MDFETGRSRGTGFVCFWKLSDADACVDEAQRMRDDLDPELASKKNPFSLLTVDPSSSRVARLVLQGRALDVTRAVSREQAEKLREAGQRLREKEDSRNLYLMREGGGPCNEVIGFLSSSLSSQSYFAPRRPRQPLLIPNLSDANSLGTLVELCCATTPLFILVGHVSASAIFPSG